MTSRLLTQQDINGGAGNDYLPGTSNDDEFNGGNGNDTLNGGLSNDTLNGGVGADDMMGGPGSDWYVVDNPGDQITEHYNWGTADTVLSNISYILGNGLENLRLVGTESVDGTGNELNNVLWGNDNGNTLTGDLGDDVLNGRGGADCMQGGADNDLYLVDDMADQVMEKANQGEQDTVLASVSYALSENVENLRLDGTGNLNATGNDQDNLIVGNGGNNRIRGFAGSNILHGDNGDDVVEGGNGLDRLYGEGGNDLLRGFEASDTLDGGTGNDQMEGGSGNDVYIVDESQGDSITELVNEGIDLVYSSVSYGLAASPQVENLILTAEGTPGQRSSTGTGNGLNNYIRGNAGDNPLAGFGGDDIINGQAGADIMVGGTGNDTFVVDDDGDQVVEEFGPDTGTLDQVLSSISYTLEDNVEKLQLIGDEAINGTGNESSNLIIGNSQNNTLDGGGILGLDTLQGGDGNDTYLVNLDNSARIYVINENSNEGIDEVRVSNSAILTEYILPDNVENLTLDSSSEGPGTGNALSNRIVGNDFGNTLDGQGGIDDLRGGNGNDTYIVDNPNDIITEEPGQGAEDMVISTSSYTLSDNLEILYINSEGGVQAIGNSIRNVIWGRDEFVESGNDSIQGLGGNDYLLGGHGNDTIEGGEGNDSLDGMEDADRLVGGIGDDYYTVDDLRDRVIEEANEGIDTVDSRVSFRLSANLENLELSGSNITGIGNERSNHLIGGDGTTLRGLGGNDIMEGGSGIDRLMGGADNDVYQGFIIDPNIERTEFGNDTIQDDSGTSDQVLLTTFAFSDVVSWQAVDSNDAGNAVDSLRINISAEDSILIANYFNNTSTQASQSGAGAGLIEGIQFSDRTLLFTDVRTLPQLQSLAIQSTVTEGSTLSDVDINRVAAGISAFSANNEGSMTSQDDTNNNPALLNLVSNQG